MLGLPMHGPAVGACAHLAVFDAVHEEQVGDETHHVTSMLLDHSMRAPTRVFR